MKTDLSSHFNEYLLRLISVANINLSDCIFKAPPLINIKKTEVAEYVSVLLFIRLFKAVSLINNKVADNKSDNKSDNNYADLFPIQLTSDKDVIEKCLVPVSSTRILNLLSVSQGWSPKLEACEMNDFFNFHKLEGTLIDSIKSIKISDFNSLITNGDSYFAFGKVLDINKISLELAQLIGSEAVECFNRADINSSMLNYRSFLTKKTTSKKNCKRITERTSKEIAELKDIILEHVASNCAQKVCSDDLEHSITVIPDWHVRDRLLPYYEDILIGALNTEKIGSIAEQTLGHFHMTYPIPIKVFEKVNLEGFNDLLVNFPNFYEATIYIRDYCKFSMIRNIPLKFPNILLVGMPGIGKSAYAIALSEAIGMACDLIPMSGLTSSMELSGLSNMWGSGQPGLVFDALSKGQIGNPILVLDEIDKCTGTGGNSLSPMNVLLSMTEEKTSKLFRESFFKFEIDLSHINWIATANDTFNILPPLLTRFKRFDVRPPSPDEMPVVFNNIYKGLLKKQNLESEFVPELSVKVIKALSDKPLRAVKECIERAIIKTIIQPLTVDGKYQVLIGMFNEEAKQRIIL